MKDKKESSSPSHHMPVHPVADITPEQERKLLDLFSYDHLSHQKGEKCAICGELTDIETAIKRCKEKDKWPNGVHYPGAILADGRHGHVECFYKSGDLKPPPGVMK